MKNGSIFLKFILWIRGVYYRKWASRKEDIKVKMMVGDDGNLSEIIVYGDDSRGNEEGALAKRGRNDICKRNFLNSYLA